MVSLRGHLYLDMKINKEIILQNKADTLSYNDITKLKLTSKDGKTIGDIIYRYDYSGFPNFCYIFSVDTPTVVTQPWLDATCTFSYINNQQQKVNKNSSGLTLGQTCFTNVVLADLSNYAGFKNFSNNFNFYNCVITTLCRNFFLLTPELAKNYFVQTYEQVTEPLLAALEINTKLGIVK